ncbi:MAG TPA: adenylate/guanylate cyclase domain-containing protein, partial [Chthoniobacterales bacterium]
SKQPRRRPGLTFNPMKSVFTALLGAALAIGLLLLLKGIGLVDWLNGVIRTAAGMPGEGAFISLSGQLLIACFAALWLAWVVVDMPSSRRKWLIMAGVIFLTLTGAGVWALYGVFFSPAVPILGALFSTTVTYVFCLIGPGLLKNRLEQIFGLSISRKHLFSLYERNAADVLVPHRVSVTVAVLEVDNHHAILESLPATEYAALTSFYFSAAADFLADSGGFLDECGGQNLRVIFGAPVANENSAAAACRALLQLKRRLDRLGAEADERWHRALEFRIGAATGEVVAGVFGANRNPVFSIAGPTVDHAHRLCDLCEHYGSHFLIGSETNQKAAESLESRPVDFVALQGHETSEMFEVLGAKNSLSPERTRSRDHYWKGVIYAREQRWDAAVEEFSRARVKGIPDPLINFYLQRIERERNLPSVLS